MLQATCTSPLTGVMIVPSASVTAAWNVTPFTVRPARFSRTLWLGWYGTTLSMARRARWNKRAKHRRVAHPTGIAEMLTLRRQAPAQLLCFVARQNDSQHKLW